MEIEVKRPTSRGWMLYFLFSIGWVGIVDAYFFVIPLALVGRFCRPAWRGAGIVMSFGVWFLMKVQPWFRPRIELDLPPLTKEGPGYLTISNHRSHLDMFILLSYLPGVRAVTKRTLFFVPFLAVMLRALRMIPVRRGEVDSYLQAMETARQALRDGDRVHIFPEMTRCPPGLVGTQDFHLMPFRMAMVAAVPLIPIVFIGTDRAWPSDRFGVRWRTPILAKTLPPLDPSRFASAVELRDAVKGLIESELAAHGS